MGRFLVRAAAFLAFAMTVTAFYAPVPYRLEAGLLPGHARVPIGSKPGDTCRRVQSSVRRDALLDPDLVNTAVTATDAFAATDAFEPRLDIGAMTGFASIALVSVVFWGRVVVATDDRKKRETVKRRRRELLIKQITGMCRPGDEDALLVAEAQVAEVQRTAWRQWFRGVRIVTEKTDNSQDSDKPTNEGGPPANGGNYTTNPFDN